MARITVNVKGTPSKALLRALKIEAEDLTPGADITVGNVRVQVATPQESDIRAFARAKGIEVGSRGRYSAELVAAFEAHQTRSQRAKDAAAARKAAKADAPMALV